MNYKVSDFVLFKDNRFEVVEDLVVKNKQKSKALRRINIESIFLLVGIFILGFIIISIIHSEVEVSGVLWKLPVVFISFILYIIVHELLHALAFMLAGDVKRKDLSFGFVRKSAMAYCITNIPVSVKCCRISLLFPFFMICVPIIIYSIAVGDIIALFAGAFFCSGSAGDFWYLRMLRGKDKNFYVLEEMPEDGLY
jgi:hypothetical protein